MIYYVKEGQNSVFCPVKVEKSLCIIPEIKFNNKKTEKIVKKFKKKKIKQVVLSNKLKEKQEINTLLNNYDITIIDGKWFMQYILDDIIKYIIEKRNIENIDEITILANDLTNEVKQNIKKFTIKYKKIRIVTNHLQRFKRLENEIFEEKGISIIVTNNKRKALCRANLIVNFDFVQEGIEQYNINENAIIINLSEKIKINKKRFNGLLITDYEVEFDNDKQKEEIEGLIMEEVREKDFSLKEIIEERIFSTVGNSNGLGSVENFVKKYNIKIKELYGMNGIIA